jgi:uncharacterized protein YhhL (DUF1145 family)
MNFRLVVVTLATLLVAAVWFCAAVWATAPLMPLYRNIIIGVALALMVVTGGGLIALMFYSRRKGYDQPARSNRAPHK